LDSRLCRQSPINSVPPPLSGKLPSPTSGDIGEESFQVKLVEFDETYGAIREYIVCVMALSAGDQTKKEPSSYSNADIAANKDGIYVAVRKPGAPAANEDFTIGSNQSKRKRRALSFSANNKALEADTFYSVFIRVYVTDDVYQSTPWYNVVKTKKASGIESWVWIVIILSVVLVLFVVAFVVTLWFCCRVKSKLVKNKKSQSPVYSDLNFIQTNNYADLLNRDQTKLNQNTSIEEIQLDRNSRISDTSAMYEDVMNYEVPQSNYEVPPSNYVMAPSNYEAPQSNYEVAPESIA